MNLFDLIFFWLQHSASRNGHRDVVDELLKADFPRSLLTPNGTALHEAALGGKVSIVRRLLDEGIDVSCLDSKEQSAVQILQDLQTPIAKDITAMICNKIEQGRGQSLRIL